MAARLALSLGKHCMPAPQMAVPQHSASGAAQREPPAQFMQTMPAPQMAEPQRTAGRTAQREPPAQCIQIMLSPQTASPQHSAGGTAHSGPRAQTIQSKPGPRSSDPGRQSSALKTAGRINASLAKINNSRKPDRLPRLRERCSLHLQLLAGSRHRSKHRVSL